MLQTIFSIPFYQRSRISVDATEAPNLLEPYDLHLNDSDSLRQGLAN